MRKRILAIAMALCLIITLLPATALAADGDAITIGGVTLSGSADSPAYAATDENGAVTKQESAEGATITWDGTTLTLNNATIKGNSERGIVYRDGDLTISLEDTNKIGEEKDGNSAASGIHVDGSLTVTGSGKLDVVGLNRGITAGSVTFNGGTVNAAASADAVSSKDLAGIYAFDSGGVTVTGGTVYAEAEGSGGRGIWTPSGGVTVNGGSVTATGQGNGIEAHGDVNISGGTVVAQGGNEGIFVAPHQEFSIKITGGEVTVTGGFNVNVTIEPEKDTAITVEYGDSASECEPRTFIYNDSYTYITKHNYFHSSTETDISKLANITVGGVGLYGTDYRIAYAKTDGDGKVTTEGATANDYNIKWDGTTLTLKGATIIAGNSDNGIVYKVTSPITIQLEGENTVTGSSGIRTNESGENLTISGGGTLNVNGVVSHAIYAAKNIEISDATVNAKSTSDYYDGINTYGGDIIINSGKVTVKSQRYGLNAYNNVSINGGTVSVDSGGYGVDIRESLTIRGGTVTIEADTQLINTKNGTVTIAPQGGTEITVKAGDSEGNAVGITIPTGGNITSSVSGAKYFHSETSGGTSPDITDVTVDPDAAEVEVGETLKFNATVSGTGDYNKGVTWSVSGNNSTGTTINGGLLTVAADETAASLTVTATSVGDNTKSGTATVTVTQAAPEPNIYVGGVGLYGSEEEPYVSNDATITWDGETLTLNGAAISGAYNYKTEESTYNYYAAIYCASGLDIVLEGANSVSCPDGYPYGEGICSPGALTVSGEGSLDVKGKYNGVNCNALTITGGTVTATGADSGSNGIFADTVTISGGTVTAEGGSAGIHGSVTVDPPEGKVIVVETGESADTASAQFCENETVLSDSGTKYFHSYVTETSEPDPEPPVNNPIIIYGVEYSGTADAPFYATTDGTANELTVCGENEEWNIKWDGEKLTLRDATVFCIMGNQAGTNTAIQSDLDVSLAIELIGDNTVVGPEYGIVAGNITISGDGTLRVWAYAMPTDGSKSYAFGGNVTITGGTVEAAGYTAPASGGLIIDPAEGGYELSAHDSFVADDDTPDWDAMAGAAEAVDFSAGSAVSLPEDTRYIKAAPAEDEPETEPDPDWPDWPWHPGGSGGTVTRYVTLTFETRGGSELDELRVPAGTTVDLSDYSSERAGYDFALWYPDESFSGSIDEIYMDRDKTVYAAWEPFADAAPGDWFYGDLVYVYENGLMDGVSETLFAPDGAVTRGMIVTILHRLEGGPVVDYLLPFADVYEGAWYAEAVRWAASEGIVTGVSESAFAPNEPITREQFAAILWRYAKYKGHDVSIGESTNILSYTDFAEISEYAIPAMQWACGEGIITGSGEGVLNPRGGATRAEAAAMLARFAK